MTTTAQPQNKTFPQESYNVDYKKVEIDEEAVYEVHVATITDSGYSVARVEEFALESNAEELKNYHRDKNPGIRAKIVEVNQ